MDGRITEARLREAARRLGLSRPSLRPRFGALPPKELIVGVVDDCLVEVRPTSMAVPGWQATVAVGGLPRGLRIRPVGEAHPGRRWRRIGCAGTDLGVRASDMQALDRYLTDERIFALCTGPEHLSVRRGKVRCRLPPDATTDEFVNTIRDAIDVAVALRAEG